MDEGLVVTGQALGRGQGAVGRGRGWAALPAGGGVSSEVASKLSVRSMLGHVLVWALQCWPSDQQMGIIGCCWLAAAVVVLHDQQCTRAARAYYSG